MRNDADDAGQHLLRACFRDGTGVISASWLRFYPVVWRSHSSTDTRERRRGPALHEGAERPAPAVLFYPGHWWADSKERPAFQAFRINMARLGFVGRQAWDLGSVLEALAADGGYPGKPVGVY